MSGADWVMTHDDAALEALTSKGLVRHAQRDLAAGLAIRIEHGAAATKVSTDGHSVTIDARGLAASRCSCPAGGVCRHIVLAVMALRGTRADSPDMGDVVTEICALAQTALRTFAGVDWSAAVALARACEPATVRDAGGTCAVELSSGVVVTFIAGAPLDRSAYKGPKTRARLATAAAALVLRGQRGIAIDVSDEPASTSTPLTTTFVRRASETLLRATRIVLGGSSPIASDMLFDLAVTARAQAAPRFAAELRRLAHQAGLAMTRDVGFEREGFIVDAARTFALVRALERSPSNPDLTGVLHRDYAAHAALTLWPLGASLWRNDTGARGLTVHAFAPQHGAWYSMTVARSAGQDPSFDPRMSYQLPLWGSVQTPNAMGAVLELSQPKVAQDRSIASTLETPALVSGRVAGLRALHDAGVAHSEWSGACRDLQTRFAGGLSRQAWALPVLLCPTRFGGFGFDEIAQEYEMEVIDSSGDALVLTVAARFEDTAERLYRQRRSIQALLVEASLGRDGLQLRPLATIHERSGALEIVNLDLDAWRSPTGLQAVLGSLREALSNPQPIQHARDLLQQLAERALAVATAGAGAIATDGPPAADACEAAGLSTLAHALRRLCEQPSVENALRTAYVAAEVRASATWT